MIFYSLKRFSLALVVVWGVLSTTFLIIHLAPGDPSSLYVRPDVDPEVVENIRRQMGLDLPIEKSYFLWMLEFVRGNLGVSFSQHRPVSEILSEAIPNTLQLTIVVFTLQLILGVILGVIIAVKQSTKLEISIGSVLLFFYSMPGFWLAVMAILLFSLKLAWLPSSQMSSIHALDGFWAPLFDRVRHLILPVFVLSAPFVAYTTRFVRNSLAEVLSQDYIRTALAYGLKPRHILCRYALKNALLPLATLTGLYLPFLLGGAVVTEYIFAWPGIGRITVNAIFSHDFPVILASVCVVGLAVVIGTLVSDLLYTLVDPRIRVSGRA